MPKTENPRTVAGSSRSYRSVVNLGSAWRRPNEDFDIYAEVFRRAGQKLTTSFEKDPAHEDFDACPIVFVFRHAVELYLKAILRAGQSLLALNGGSITFKESVLTSHRLAPLLKPTRELFKELGWLESYEEFSPFVRELDRVDPNSFAFRYPVDTQDGAALPDDLIFDLPSFSAHADGILEILSCTMWALEADIQSATEHLSETSAEL